MKKIHRFLIDQYIPSEGNITITNTEVVHIISSVLRIAPGEQVIFFSNGSPDFHTTLTSVTKKGITGDVVSVFGNYTKPPRELVVAIAITKNNFDTIVQKLTELGVQTIVPLISDRVIKKEVRLDRLQKISNEALEQCGGNTVVHIIEPLSIEQTLLQYGEYTPYSFDTLNGHAEHKKEAITYSEKSIIFIGPEGGWSDTEREYLKEHTTVLSLGARILKADTAAIVASYEVLR
ncbi:MAG: RsmE family RNA methyltransferase [bacterium]